MNRSERMAIKEQMERIEKKCDECLARVDALDGGLVEQKVSGLSLVEIMARLEAIERKRGPGRPPKDNGLSDGRRETT